MTLSAAAVPVKGWVIVAATVAVFGVGAARIATSNGHSGTGVLGEKRVAASTANNGLGGGNGNGNGGVGNGNGNGNQPTFSVVGTPPTNVRPGASSAVDVTITNTNNFAISVTQIAVAVPFTLSPAVTGCPVAGNFSTVSYTGAAITVAKNATLKLSQTSIPSSQWPQIKMANATSNQDACQGAQFTLSIQATAVKA